MPWVIQVLSRRSGLIVSECSGMVDSRSAFQVKKFHLLLRLGFVSCQPVPIDRPGALSREFDFLRTTVPGQPIDEIRCGGVWREVWAVQGIRHADVAALHASAYKEHRLVEVPCYLNYAHVNESARVERK